MVVVFGGFSVVLGALVEEVFGILDEGLESVVAREQLVEFRQGVEVGGLFTCGELASVGVGVEGVVDVLGVTGEDALGDELADLMAVGTANAFTVDEDVLGVAELDGDKDAVFWEGIRTNAGGVEGFFAGDELPLLCGGVEGHV